MNYKFHLLLALGYLLIAQSLHAQGDTWIQKSDVGYTASNGPTARYAAVAFSIGTKGYVGTGWDGGLRKDFWEFDPVSNSWTQKADFGGTARSLAVGFSIGTKGYIGTGSDGTSRKDFWAMGAVEPLMFIAGQSSGTVNFG